MAAATFSPPTSIGSNPFAIIEACENAELSNEGGADLPSVQLAELAALLVVGEYGPARDLLRRHEDCSPDTDQFLALWEAGRAMEVGDSSAAMDRLARCCSDGSGSPRQPLATFAAEGRDAYRARVAGELAECYGRISAERCGRLLGFGGEEAAAWLARRGWTVSRGGDGSDYLVVPNEGMDGGDGGEEGQEGKEVEASQSGRIHELTEIVAFMERSTKIH